MKKNYKNLLLTATAIVFSILGVFSQNFWQKSSHISKANAIRLEQKITPKESSIFDLDISSFKKTFLSNRSLNKQKRISFPNEKGELETYEVEQISTLSKELQKKYPNIKSYSGKKLNGTTRVRFSISPYGMHAMFLKENNQTTFIDPYTKDGKSYMIYSRNSLSEHKDFICKVGVNNTKNYQLLERNYDTNDNVLRIFRLAVATTAEYSAFHLKRQNIPETATEKIKKEAVLAAVNTTITRVNGIYERDVAITMQLVANNDKIIFFDTEKDGFTNNDSFKLIAESQKVIDANIGTSNYDIGHTFSTGGGGLADLSSVCSHAKARGVTGTYNPVGDPYDVDFVSHEIGHQFGATHTFNGTTGNCIGSNKTQATAVEPGSGSTIMGYAGICSPQNLQANTHPYFHLVSIRQIRANVTKGSITCATKKVINNKAPIINPLSHYTIPKSTPFVLEAVATDQDNDNLTYTWEQLDTELGLFPIQSTATQGPIFRSILPSNSPKRYFPNLKAILLGKTEDASKYEVLPSVGRKMKFGVTVRDNNPNGGQTASAETTVTVNANSGPFKITSQNTATTWQSGSLQEITWSVANTNAPPINTQKVNILFSFDGGKTFPKILAENIPNKGSYKVSAPTTATNKGRIKIQPIDNIYFDINDVAITITPSSFDFIFTERNKQICLPNSVKYNFVYKPKANFSEEVTFSALNLPEGVVANFSPQTASVEKAVILTLTNITSQNIGNHFIEIKGTSATKSNNAIAYLKVKEEGIEIPVLSSPLDKELGVYSFDNFFWKGQQNAEKYTIEVSNDVEFKNIVALKETENTSININSLEPNTTYYWRVKAFNFCGESAYSKVRQFKTVPASCKTVDSGSLNKNIPDNNTTGITSTLTINENVYLKKVEVKVNISHDYLGDLTLKLINPNGQEILLAENIGGYAKSYTNVIFDDLATQSIFTATPPITGRYKPQETIIKSNLEQSKGEWKLKIIDSGQQDTGVLKDWSISVCGEKVNYLDADNDGVTDDKDKCPNTPPNTQVDSNGCAIFTLPYNNFTLQTLEETCPNKNNGKVFITAKETHNYIATLNGVAKEFTNKTSFTNLKPGTYDVCIAVANKQYEQCFSFTVNKAVNLLAKTVIANKKMQVQIQQGTPPFYVYLNGVKQFETQAKKISIPVKHNDLVEIKTKSSCRGEIIERINLFEKLTAYPNPTTSKFEILVPNKLKEVQVDIYSSNLQLVKTGKYPIINGKVQLSIANQPTGIYLVKVYLEKPAIAKVIKY